MSIMQDDVRQVLVNYEQTDDGLLLLEVFRRAAQYGIPAPPDAYLALSRILERYHSAECRTLDEAFNVKRPPNWKQPAAHTKRKTSTWEHTNRAYRSPPGMSAIGRLWLRAKDLQGEGMPTDAPLWEALADEFHVSASRAREWFYEVERRNKR